MLAAEVLAKRGTRAAIDHLVRLVDSRDPYRAAAAARALLAFDDDPAASATVRHCRHHSSALVRDAVSRSAPRWLPGSPASALRPPGNSG